MRKLLATAAVLAAIVPFTAGMAMADDATYRVTVTNVTYAQPFAPFVVATHRAGSPVFTPGAAASAELATLAETGNPGPLLGAVSAMPGVADAQTNGGLLLPGETATIVVAGGGGAKFVSVAGMLVTTNDGFAGLNGVAVPKGGRAAKYHAPAWDAGSEANDELCANIPGPPCAETSGNGHVDEDGTVRVHRGIHGVGDLTAADSDWRNPVAIVTITKIGDDD